MAKIRKIRKDVSGLRFGRLVAIEVSKVVNHYTFWRCRCDCGNYSDVRISQVLSGRTKSCGCYQREHFTAKKGELNHNWRGGRYTNPNTGYVSIKKPEHPNAKRRGMVLEHVYVMSEFLGRPILPTETIHHKNGIKSDNRIENLELWVGNHGKGQRVDDVIKWAFEVLLRSKPINSAEHPYRPLIYVAGALRGDVPTYISNCSRMIKYAESIRRSGVAVYIPCLDLLQGLVMGDMEFTDYFNNSFEVLKRCDGVYLVPGWENSEGTKREIALAESIGIPVFSDMIYLKQYNKEVIVGEK